MVRISRTTGYYLVVLGILWMIYLIFGAMVIMSLFSGPFMFNSDAFINSSMYSVLTPVGLLIAIMYVIIGQSISDQLYTALGLILLIVYAVEFSGMPSFISFIVVFGTLVAHSYVLDEYDSLKVMEKTKFGNACALLSTIGLIGITVAIFSSSWQLLSFSLAQSIFLISLLLFIVSVILVPFMYIERGVQITRDYVKPQSQERDVGKREQKQSQREEEPVPLKLLFEPEEE